MKRKKLLLLLCLLILGRAGYPQPVLGWPGLGLGISDRWEIREPGKYGAPVLSKFDEHSISSTPAPASPFSVINDFKVHTDTMRSVFVQQFGDLACSRWPAKVWTVWYDERSPYGDIYLQRFDSLMLDRIGPNIKVNDDTTQYFQCYPSLDCDSLGYVVVVWSDGRVPGTYGQRFSPDGFRIGSNFRIKPDAVMGFCYYSDVTYLPSGRFAVSTVIDSYQFGRLLIFLQFFNADGSYGPTRFPDSLATGSQNWSAVAYGGGRLVVCWYGYQNSRWDLYARIYDPLGTPLSPAFRVSDVNAVISYPIYRPALAVNSSGGFIIIWEDGREGTVDIYAQVYDQNGNPLGGNVRVNSNAAGYQSHPQAYYIKDGVYRDYLIASWYNGNESTIHGILVNPSGGIIYDGQLAPPDAFPIGSHRLELCRRTPTGDSYLGAMVWDASLPPPYMNRDVWAKDIFNVMSPAWRCSRDSLGANQRYPSVGADSNGRWAVVWEDGRLPGRKVIMGRAFMDNGNPASEESMLSDSLMSGGPGAFDPSVAINGRGDFVCVWRDMKSITGMRGNLYTGPLWVNFRVSADTSPIHSKIYPMVSLDEAGNFMAIWLSSQNIYCRGFSASGTPRTSVDLKVNPEGVDAKQYNPGVIYLGSGRYGLFYAANVSGRAEIFCRLALMQTDTIIFLGPPTKVSDNTINDALHFGVASDTTKFLIAWGEIYGKIRGRYFDRDAIPLVNGFDICDDWMALTSRPIRVAMDRQGRAAVVWDEYTNRQVDAGDVNARIYNANFTPYTPVFRVPSGRRSYYQSCPAVAAGGNKFYFVWEDGRLDTCGTDVFAKGYTWEELGVASGLMVERKVGSLKLLPNVPNPFNRMTTIRYQITKPGKVSLKVYNVAGQCVKTLVSEFRVAGSYEVCWDGRDEGGRQVANGAYIYRLSTDEGSLVGKMNLIR